MERCNIVWFDHDFRIQDQPALTAACGEGLPVIGVYVDSLKTQRQSQPLFPKRSPLQQQALYHVLHELKQHLATLNIELYVFTCAAREAIAKLRQHIEINHVYALTPRAYDEGRVLAKLTQEMNVPLTILEGRRLLITQDWMSPVPTVFTAFRKLVQKQGVYRPASTSPKPVSPFSLPISDDLDTFNLNLTLPFELGIEAAQNRLTYYLTSGLVTTYKETRNGMLNVDDSSKLSIHLAFGSLSATMVHEALADYEQNVISNESTYWLRFELWWREFFYLLQEETPNIYTKVQPGYFTNQAWIEAWINGQTGYPLVDAAMRELKATGYMSNRGRQNVASFFVHYLKQDWRIGADYFATTLLDYDPSSNYLNWQYVAGVGNDPRDHRIFNVHKQGRDYDPTGAYAKHWLPELGRLSVFLLYPKSPLTDEQQQQLSEVGYPMPIVKMPF